MRFSIFCFFLFLFSLLKAEDIIVLRNGDMESSIVTEITPTQVKYKRNSNPNGPTYTIDKADVLSIKYANGEIEKFTVDDSIENHHKGQNSATISNTLVNLTPDENNEAIINLYNCQYPSYKGKKPKSKVVKDAIVYWGISQESIVSTDDLEIVIEPVNANEKVLYDYFDNGGYIKFWVKNKTEKPLYIDLANSFKVNNIGGESTGSTWYDPTQYSENTTSGSGISIGLGAVASALGIGGTVGTLANGISIGGGGSNGVSTTYQMERILVVPPYSKACMPGLYYTYEKEVHVAHEDFNIINYCHMFDGIKPKLAVNKYDFRKYNYDYSPLKKSYYIACSDDASFSSYFVIPLHLYVRAIYGSHTFIDLKPKDLEGLTDKQKIIIGEMNL